MKKLFQYYFIFKQNLYFYFVALYYNIKIKNKKSDVRFTVIIPTLFLSEYTHHLVEALNNTEFVDEILLIDNTNSHGKELIKFSKVKVLNQSQNLYVNPSWNLGVSRSKNENIIVCNDDILFDVSIIPKIASVLSDKIGIIGIESTPAKKLSISVAKSRKDPFGVVMFLHKSSYNQIPNDLLIWYGDDYLFYASNKINFKIKGFGFQTKMATSSSQKPFSIVKENDKKMYHEKYKNKLGNTIYVR